MTIMTADEDTDHYHSKSTFQRRLRDIPSHGFGVTRSKHQTLHRCNLERTPTQQHICHRGRIFFFGRLNQFSRMKLSKSKTRDGVLVIQFPAEVTCSGLRGKCVSVTEPGHLHDTEPGISKTHARLLRRRRIIDSSHGEFWRHGTDAPRFVQPGHLHETLRHISNF
jgi:hypothetical protein